MRELPATWEYDVPCHKQRTPPAIDRVRTSLRKPCLEVTESIIRACGRPPTSDRSGPPVVRKPCLEVTESIIRACGRHRTSDRSTPHDRSVDPAHGAKASHPMDGSTRHTVRRLPIACVIDPIHGEGRSAYSRERPCPW